MKKRRKKFHKIKNLSQLQRNKRILDKKIRIREKILKRRLKSFQATLTPDTVYDEVLKTTKMQDSLLRFIPQLLKMKLPAGTKLNDDSKKQIMLALFSGLGASIASVFAFRRRKAKTSKKEKFPEEQLFI